MESKFAKMNLEEKQLDCSLIYDGNLIHVYKDNVLLPNGKQIVRESGSKGNREQISAVLHAR